MVVSLSLYHAGRGFDESIIEQRECVSTSAAKFHLKVIVNAEQRVHKQKENKNFRKTKLQEIKVHCKKFIFLQMSEFPVI